MKRTEKKRTEKKHAERRRCAERRALVHAAGCVEAGCVLRRAYREGLRPMPGVPVPRSLRRAP